MPGGKGAVTTNKFSKRQHICGTKPYSFTLADSGYGEPCEIRKPKKKGLKILENGKNCV